MSVTVLPSTIRRGDPWSFPVQRQLDGVVVNITGRTYRSQIRVDPGELAAGTPAASCTCVVTDAVNGIFTVSLTAAQTAVLTGYKYWIDFEETVPTFEPVHKGYAQVQVGPVVTK